MIRRRPKISRRQLLESAPRLNPEVRWQELDSGGIMVTYRKAARGPGKWLRRLLVLPETAELALDGMGAKVVRKIDGERTVSDLIGYVAGEFKLSRKESEVALLRYLGNLGRRGLIWFKLPDPGAER